MRYPSKDSLRAFFSYSTRETHPALDEKFVMETALAAKVLHRKVPAQEYSDQKHLESFWVINSSAVNSLKNDSSFTENKGPCLSDLECKFMVRWGTRRQVKYLGRHKETASNSNHTHNSSSSLVNVVCDDEKEIFVEELENEADGDEINDVNGDNKESGKDEIEENEEENRDDLEDEEEEEYTDQTEKNLKRKGYTMRNRNVKEGKKGKVEIKKQTQKQKKNMSKKKKCKNSFREAIILRNPKDRWSSER